MTQSICASANLDPPLVNVSEDGVARDNVPSHSGSQSKRKRAVLITAGDPPNYSLLAQAKSDTWALKALLRTFQYLDDDIVVMMKDENIDKNLWPRRNNICIELQKLVERSSPGDHLFVYFSGHGGQVECIHNTESDGYDECIFDCSGKRIIDNVLHKYLVEKLPRECKLFALWDACHTGTILDLDHHKCNEPHAECSTSSNSRQNRKATVYGPKMIDKTTHCSLGYPSRGRSIVRSSLPLPPDLRNHWRPIFPEKERFCSPEPIHPPVPVPLYISKCNGRCPLPPADLRATRAHIVSLSACKDDEWAYDDEESNESLTKFFMACMEENPNATLRQLLDYIRTRVNQMIQRKRNATFNAADDSAKQRSRPQTSREDEVMVDNVEDLPRLRHPKRAMPQIPGYSSHFKLDLDEPVDL